MTDSATAGAFAGLTSEVREALGERGFEEPTEPQRRAIPPLASGEDGLIIAPTGTGKTETAMLPVFDAILKRGPTFGIAALYITPLRALNRDMRDRLEWWGERLDIAVDVRHGDTSQYHRTQQANDPPDVLITTPETLQAMLTGEKLRRALSDIEHVIVDEIHELAGSKRGTQLSIGLERLRELTGDVQRIGLSATVGQPEEVGRFLTGGTDPTIIEVDVGSRLELSVVHPTVTEEDRTLAGELAIEPEMGAHLRAIRDRIDRHESTLIFVNTRQTAEALGARFLAMETAIGVHHGSLSKDSRIDVEDRFKAGELDALLCTSSMELGIDVGRVDHVIQYGSPREVTRLLQRVGRAGHRIDRVSSGTIIARHPDDILEASVIGRRGLAGLVEPASIHYGSLDTVANQVAGLVMDFGEIDARRAYEIITRAYPFRDLSEDEFRSVVREVANNRVVWLEEADDRLEKRNGTWQYYYQNLSMIPDEETYTVRDMAGGGTVGTLDERFVVNFASPGATFIEGGQLWRIVEVDEEESRVEATPVDDPGGEVPSWVGAEIPVPYAVAQEVGEIRETVETGLQTGDASAGIAAELSSTYPTTTDAIRSAIDPITEQIEEGDPIPTDDRIVIESAADTIVIVVAGGHEVNETLGRLCSSLLGQAVGSSIGMEVDPYRIELDVPPRVTMHDAVEVLTDTDPDHVEGLLELALKRSENLAFRLTQVAATFGGLKRWQGSGSDLGANRLLGIFEDTPIYDEAVRAVFHEDLDVSTASEVLSAIQVGEIEIETIADRTPIGRGGRSSGRDLLTPEQADAGVIETVRERIMDDRIRLLCLHCREWDRRTKVNRVRDQPECPSCGSTRIAALNPWADETVQAVTSKDKSDEQESLTQRAHRSANLVQSHGKKAVIALAARGVGPENAARIINNWREDEDDFYRDILARERQYARTKAFWD